LARQANDPHKIGEGGGNAQRQPADSVVERDALLDMISQRVGKSPFLFVTQKRRFPFVALIDRGTIVPIFCEACAQIVAFPEQPRTRGHQRGLKTRRGRPERSTNSGIVVVWAIAGAPEPMPAIMAARRIPRSGLRSAALPKVFLYLHLRAPFDYRICPLGR